ncbi:zinc finger FYVE domain-containing protein 1-like isoform X2 [Ceratina calcarata]|nr:zinc finger FYVE domain-containing protein 1-like isoform X2 [Ceratina calcarata]XP_017879093.1 zinc finger FYVE domain-containing protein 1-like isoform X2 [Ceratina calcarata]XP_017879094.1 zinc finger FYVE domain-containing protein 1-like isoform X2 [Ceratina calcarata]
MSTLSRDCKLEATGPAIMQSLDSMRICDMDDSNQDIVSLDGNSENRIHVECQCNKFGSFLLIDGQEHLKVSSAEQFVQKLNYKNRNLKVKVVSIFGITGDGKSHTLNKTFFEGRQVFKTSNDQNSCTLGVWAALDPVLNVICLDTEGLLGVTSHKNERIRLLLKVLAVSDVVIYRTQSEKLNTDLFTFLGTASRAYSHHFQAALQAVGHREGVQGSLSSLGPSVIVLHETRYTIPLTNNSLENVEDVLRARFVQLKLETEAFSSIKYVGIHTKNSATNYERLRTAVKRELYNNNIRSPRKPHVVYNTLKVLNETFIGELDNASNVLFPDQYFTCPAKCLSCGSRCCNSMGHLEGKPHSSNSKCRYQNQYDNVTYICKKCYNDGNEVQMRRVQNQNDNSWYGLVKYAWSGDVIECPHCGEMSRQYWYSNKDPEDFAVRTEITHVWSTANNAATQHNTAQRVVDSVSYITEAVTNVSLQPTKVVSAWVADKVAPSYWRPNNEIKHCHKCRTPFGLTDTKHHCRACGEGFCGECSSKTKCVPSRNWHTPVRVCDTCYDKNEPTESSEDVNARKVSEQVISTLSAVGTVLNYSKTFIKDTVRPSYWIPDSEIVNCHICKQNFSVSLPLHHCRNCGHGVCHNCSLNRKPVPHRGWDEPVRVCDSCVNVA